MKSTLHNMITPATAPTQKDSILRSGNAMSLAPIMSGIKKLPNPPTMMGITTRKIIIVACMVNSML
jgi:hypothetical protein